MEVNVNNLMTQAAYAKRRRVTRQAVTKMIMRGTVQTIKIEGARLVILDEPISNV